MLRFFLALAQIVILSSVIGAAGYLAVWYLRDISALGNVVEQTNDVVQAVSADRVPARKFKTPIVVVNIDGHAFERLGRPVPMRKHVIGKILRQLREMRPAAIVVDIDIGWPTDDADAQQLMHVLEFWPSASSPVLFVRELTGPPYSVRTLTPTPYDRLLTVGRNTRWVTAQGIESVSDQMLRRIENAPRTCIGVTPYLAESVALAINGPAMVSPPPQPWSCPAVEVSDAVTTPPPIDRIADYVHYTMRWNNAPNSGVVRSVDGMARPLISVVSAMPFLSAEESPAIATELFEGSVVIVGAAHSFSRDYHQTPVGRMPGFYVIANHIRGSVERSDEKNDWENGLWVSVALSVATGIVCLVFPWTSNAWVQLLVAPLVTVAWWLSYVFLLSGGIYVGLLATQLVAGVVSTIAATRRTIPNGASR